jgi:hypothetical protein
MPEITIKKREIRSGLKKYVFSNGDFKLKGWFSLIDMMLLFEPDGFISMDELSALQNSRGKVSIIDIIKLHNPEGRVYIDILPRFETTPAGFTHIVFEKVKPDAEHAK